jgi:hypothetical protein
MENDTEIEPMPPKRRGRPPKLDEDVIFGHDIDSDEEKRLREENEIALTLEREDATTSTIIVNRRQNRQERYAHLAEIGLKDYNREEIARQYGGGEYRCRIRRSDGSFGPTWYFSVDRTRKCELDADGQGTSAGYDAVKLVETVADRLISKNSSPDQNNFIAMMSQKSDDMMKMMMMQQQESTKLLVGMMQAFAQMNQNHPPAPVGDNALTQISTTLLKHSLEQNGTRMDDMIGTMIKLKKLSEDDSENSEEGGGGSFLKDIVGAIPLIMKQVFQAQAAPTIEPLPNQAKAPIAPQEVKVDVAPVPPPINKIGLALANLIQFAESNANPEDVHNAYEPMLSSEEYEALAKYLDVEDWWEKLTTLLPHIKDHKAWFTELRALIIADPVIVEDSSQPVIGVPAKRSKKKVDIKT